ncbi:MAG TPA: flagellar hook-basal body complex protein FliE [Caulobacteraceae bacterium]|jgi:flagellar hook-basal body complex protein FliE
MTVPAINAVSALPTAAASGTVPVVQPQGVSFSKLMTEGFNGVNQKMVEADAMVQAFTLDDSIPVHQVTYALEHARLSFELALQVRNRLVEGYQELMRMQL